MYLVDVHCHVDHERFSGDVESMLQTCKDNDVKAIIAQGVNFEGNERVLAFARKYSFVKAAMGMYPSEALNNKTHDDYSKETKHSFAETLRQIEEHKTDIVAIGEIGMDFQESDDKETQMENFKKIIALAKKIQKPLIIHTRKAEQECIDILEESGIDPKLVLFHCFCGKKKLIERCVKLGYYFSIPCNISRAQNFQQMATIVPITQLLTETDGPYMPYDKELLRSEPHHVIHTVKKIAEIKGMTCEDVADSIFMNYQRLFL